MKKRFITLSVLIHSAILLSLFVLSSTLINGNQSDSQNAMMVNVSGDPSKNIGSGNNSVRTSNSSIKNSKVATTGINNNLNIGTVTGLSGNGGGTGFNVETSYAGSIVKKIQEYKYYPLSAKKNKLTGSTKLKFTILNNGEIKNDTQIIRSSGHQILDDTAINIIKNSAPFPAFPESIKEKELSLNVNIDFSL